MDKSVDNFTDHHHIQDHGSPFRHGAYGADSIRGNMCMTNTLSESGFDHWVPTDTAVWVLPQLFRLAVVKVLARTS